MQKKFWLGAMLLVSALLLTSTTWASSFRVVTTTSTLGMLAEEIGGDLVQVRVLAAPDRDAHDLDARPSFMAAVRRADLLIEMGAGLEEGWLPAVTGNAANPGVNVGRSGHLRASDFTDLRPSITVDGPNAGHVHDEGNPHFNVDPYRMARVAHAIGQRLGLFFPEQAEELEARAEALGRQLRDHAEALADRIKPNQQFIVYHEDLDYLEEWLPVKSVGYLEPIPGLPPTSAHLRRLVRQFEAQQGRILYASHQPERGARFLEQQLGWPKFALPLEPPIGEGLAGYLQLMNQWAASFEHH
ncbi:metal ABC transporter substrate-binding protein [Desulfurivibrio alkaliphilus]|uniref:Periplasmic solute binding protein n=1 Tax=Desulfurivibrio alkaliphilus (strain DSM 19089 / UNIQEM U267 / AHT2) TaxID=589865 RepID=D6Z139_DESAT|nr:metal ABC transporter substrate-binding protein [Desulfurivibrio alkaliphilus]ADH87299.1 periplasmic solute binding protein [Desulfurivibrio alkaliphilus AHT 2]